MSTTPTSARGTPSSCRRDGRSPQMSHAAASTMTTWRLLMTVASPAPMQLDAVMEEHEVEGEEDAGEERPAAHPEGARTAERILASRDEPEQRQRVEAAEQRGGARRGARRARR